MDTPPGLKYMNLTYLTSGGDENEWLPFTKVKYYTNAFIVKDNQVRLPLTPVFLFFPISLRCYWGIKNADSGWASS